MTIKQITPDKAKEILDKDSKAVYLDVRSVPEFELGHAAGAINVPIAHWDDNSSRMIANADFTKVVQGVLPKEAPLVVGCKSGGRSQAACEVMDKLGYTGLHNIQGGFAGSPDQKGWRDFGFPVSQDNGEGVNYESLAKKSKK